MLACMQRSRSPAARQDWQYICSEDSVDIAKQGAEYGAFFYRADGRVHALAQYQLHEEHRAGTAVEGFARGGFYGLFGCDPYCYVLR